MRTKTGIWLIGACGNVGMLTIVGARAMARGLAGATGLVTELKDFHALDLARVDGAEIPDAMHGKSFAPQLRGESDDALHDIAITDGHILYIQAAGCLGHGR